MLMLSRACPMARAHHSSRKRSHEGNLPSPSPWRHLDPHRYYRFFPDGTLLYCTSPSVSISSLHASPTCLGPPVVGPVFVDRAPAVCCPSGPPHPYLGWRLLAPVMIARALFVPANPSLHHRRCPRWRATCQARSRATSGLTARGWRTSGRVRTGSMCLWACTASRART